MTRRGPKDLFQRPTRQQEGDEAIARAWAKAQSKPEDETTLPALGIDIKDYNRSNGHVEFRQEELEIRERQLKQAIADCVTAKDLGDRAVELGLELGRREAVAIERADKAEAERDTVKAEMDAYKMSDASNREECSHWASMFAISNASFKNFHRSLCERFGYVHDEKDWKRDQVSLEEYIWGELKTSQDELRQADSLFAIAEKTVEELTEKLFRYESQADAVVGQETPQDAFERGQQVMREKAEDYASCSWHVGCSISIREIPKVPYTPPLKAGQK